MRIGIADTTFSRMDLGQAALETLKQANPKVQLERYTVPGCKDLPVASKILLEKYHCDLVLALGWVGKERIDEVCAHEANQGLIQVELMTNKHILKVFFHERETSNLKEQKKMALERSRKHALNALALLKGKEALSKWAGKGKRQGSTDAGEL